MKKSIKFTAIFGLFLLSGLALMSLTSNDGSSGRIKVYIVNKCSSDVKYKVDSPGSSTSYTADDGSKVPNTFMEGTKIYNSDGDLAHEVTSASEGKDVIVCD